MANDQYIDLCAYARKLETVKLGYHDDYEWAKGYKAGQSDAAGGLRAILRKVAPSDSALRDEIAVAVLPAVVSRCGGDTHPEDEAIEDYFARRSYMIADAMLKARGHG